MSRVTKRGALLGPLIVALAVAHGGFAWVHRDLRPELEVLTPPPEPWARTAAAAGDSQFLYRMWAIELQNAGDTGGRATRMADYNYDLVIDWLETLQSLDARAHQHASLAGNYFAMSPKTDQIRRVAAFLADDAALNPSEKWMWMVRAIEIAASRLKDENYALALAQRLAAFDVPAIPFKVLSLPAVFLDRLGRREEARAALDDALSRRDAELSDDDRKWASTFLLQLP